MPILDLKTDFSATGDGVTDDSAALFSALDYCGCNGTDLRVPKGTYLFSQAYTFKAGFRIVGSGEASIFKLKDASTITAGDALFAPLPGIGTTIENLVIDGNKAGNPLLSVNGFDVPVAVSGLSLRSVVIKNMPGSASNGTGLSVATTLQDLTFTEVRCESNDLYGILVTDGDDLTFDNCECTSNGSDGINVSGASRSSIIGGRYYNNVGDNIAIGLNTTGVTIFGSVATISGDTAVDSMSAVNDASVGTVQVGGVVYDSLDDPGSKFVIATGGVTDFNGRTGSIVPAASDYDAIQIDNTPAGTIAATNVQAALDELDTEKAPLASPTFTGTPAAPTPSRGDNDTSIATTEFVTRALPWANVMDYGATGLGVADDTAAIQSTVDAGTVVIFPPGIYKLSDAITLDSNHHIILGPDVRINQTVANKAVFKATLKDNIHIEMNGALLYGEGSWSSGWTGFSGHEDVGILLLGCTRTSVSDLRAKNFASAGVAVRGGNRIKIINPIIEGTHAYSTALSSGDNFQAGIYANHDQTYGTLTNFVATGIDISGTAQGFMGEMETGYAGECLNWYVSGIIHDIPGQHGVYHQGGGIRLDLAVNDVALSGVKIQSGAANQDIRGFHIDLVARGTGSQALEISTAGTGWTSSGVAKVAAVNCQRGVTLNAKIRNWHIDAVVETTSNHGCVLQGADLHDINLHLTAKDTGLFGLLVTATSSDGVRVWPKIRNPNTTNAASTDGIGIQSASAQVEFFDTDVVDANTQMTNGIYSTNAGATLKFRGSVKVTGAASYGVRFAGPVAEWPTEATLSGTTAAIHDTAMLNSTQPVVIEVQSTSATTVKAWARELDDESAYLARAEIVGKLSGSAERAGYVSTVIAYRDAGGAATIEGSADTDVSVASASFAGAYAWAVSGNYLRLNVNSGGAATYDWIVRVTAIKVSG